MLWYLEKIKGCSGHEQPFISFLQVIPDIVIADNIVTPEVGSVLA